MGAAVHDFFRFLYSCQPMPRPCANCPTPDLRSSALPRTSPMCTYARGGGALPTRLPARSRGSRGRRQGQVASRDAAPPDFGRDRSGRAGASSASGSQSTAGASRWPGELGQVSLICIPWAPFVTRNIRLTPHRCKHVVDPPRRFEGRRHYVDIPTELSAEFPLMRTGGARFTFRASACRTSSAVDFTPTASTSSVPVQLQDSNSELQVFLLVQLQCTTSTAPVQCQRFCSFRVSELSLP